MTIFEIFVEETEAPAPDLLAKAIQCVKSNIQEYGRLSRDYKVETNGEKEHKKWTEAWTENRWLLSFLQSLEAPAPAQEKNEDK